MAGMLPGVECARRRRLRQFGGDSPGGSRRLSLCLYTTNYEGTNSSTASPRRSVESDAYEEEKLSGAAGEAKERLDERFKLQRKSSKLEDVTGKGNLGSKSTRLGKLGMVLGIWRPTC